MCVQGILVFAPRPLAYPAFTNEACLLSAVTVYNLEKEQFCFVYFSGGNLVGLWIAQHLNSLSVWEKSQDIWKAKKGSCFLSQFLGNQINNASCPPNPSQSRDQQTNSTSAKTKNN